MKNYESLFNTNDNLYNPCCEVITGNNIDMELCKDDCEVRADIVVSRNSTVRVWGQVKDCNDNPIGNALVKLVKPVLINGCIEYTGIAHTLTDCAGFYQFDIETPKTNSRYKILVGKATEGNDKTINSSNCAPCSPNPCAQPPCPPPQPPYKPNCYERDLDF
jgi:hypothetical protein